MKHYKYPEIQALHSDQRKLVDRNYDDWNLVTGRVGKGKSKWARKNARVLDPSFNLDRIHFTEDAFWDDYKTLSPGQAIILDEFDGHRRASMRGERVTFLERMKRTRSRRLHVYIIYDRVSTLDRDLLTDRNAYWHHIEYRGTVMVRQPDTKLMFHHGEPIEPTTHPIVGDFDFTAWEPKGFEAAYDAKKHRMTDILTGGKVRPEPQNKLNLRLLDLVQAELNR